MRTQEQADIPAPQMSCYLCNVKELKVGQTVGGGGGLGWAERTPVLPSGSRGWKGGAGGGDGDGGGCYDDGGRCLSMFMSRTSADGCLRSERQRVGILEKRKEKKKTDASTFRDGAFKIKSFSRPSK